MQSPLDSRQLIAFSTLARTGSYSQTARELFLTHSAISHSMRALENEIGCRLLHRVGKRVTLTEAGEALLHHAERALKELDQARTTLGNLNRWGFQRLRLGAEPMLAQFLLVPVLAELRKTYHKLLIEIVRLGTADTDDALKDGSVDMVLGERPVQLYDVDFVTVVKDRFVIAVAPDHRWAAHSGVLRDDLAKEPCILAPKATPSRMLVESYFAEEGITLNPIIETDDPAAMLELAKAGHGPAIVPLWMAKRAVAEGTLVALALGKSHLPHTWGLMYQSNRRLRPMENQFVKLLLAQGREPHPEPLPADVGAGMEV